MENKMNNKIEGVIAIVAGLLVMFSAMWDARVSLGVAVVALLGLGIWQLVQYKQSMAGIKPGVIEKQAELKEENKRKILKFLEEKALVADQDELKILNNDVEKLLGVSNATAERYLHELEKEGVLKQVGIVGQSVYYVKI
jgi:hypothetical protein